MQRGEHKRYRVAALIAAGLMFLSVAAHAGNIRIKNKLNRRISFTCVIQSQEQTIQIQANKTVTVSDDWASCPAVQRAEQQGQVAILPESPPPPKRK